MLNDYQIERQKHYNKMSSNEVLGEMKAENLVWSFIYVVCMIIGWILSRSFIARTLWILGALLVMLSVTSSAERMHKTLKILSKDVTRQDLAPRNQNLIWHFLSETVYHQGAITSSVLGVYETDYAILIEFRSTRRKNYQANISILNKNTIEWQRLKKSDKAMKILNKIKLIDAANRRKARRYRVNQLFYIDKTTKSTSQVSDKVTE